MRLPLTSRRLNSAPRVDNILAIVGRPNVGKSTLFNRIVGRKIAIVHEEPGVTRDRVSAPARWCDRSFEVIDTGGIAFMDEEKTSDALAEATRRQAEVAMAMATAIVLVVDVTSGVSPLDLDIARQLRASGKPVLLAVNKVDNNRRESGVGEFAELGFARVFPIAAVHGLGVAALLDAATDGWPATAENAAPPPPQIAIVGRPNVGKSSLVNAILKSERTIVSEVPGTTRDSVDVPVAVGGRSYVLVDTAGLRHRSKIRTSVDQFGLMRAERSIRQCDLAVLVLDAVAGVTKQDKRIGGMIAEARRACVIVVNKWDLAAEQEQKRQRIISRNKKKTPPSFQEEYLAALRRELFFLDWAPVLFASAKTGARVDELFDRVAAVESERQRRVETPALNQLLARALTNYPPPMCQGKRLKIYYACQKPGGTPTFALFVNEPRALTPHYARFLTDRIRGVWGFSGCPVTMDCRRRVRRSRGGPARA